MILTEEQWRPVYGYAECYKVSENGRVRRVGRALLQGKIQNGYHRVCLSRNGQQTLRFVHVLVAEAFLPLRPTPKHQVNHKNGDRLDNNFENLEWVTASENQLHSYRELGRVTPDHVRRAAPKGEHSGRAKLTDAQVHSIRVRRAHGERQADLAREYGVHTSTVSRIVSGQSRSSCGLAGSPE